MFSVQERRKNGQTSETFSDCVRYRITWLIAIFYFPSSGSASQRNVAKKDDDVDDQDDGVPRLPCLALIIFHRQIHRNGLIPKWFTWILMIKYLSIYDERERLLHALNQILVARWEGTSLTLCALARWEMEHIFQGIILVFWSVCQYGRWVRAPNRSVTLKGLCLFTGRC